MSIISFKCIDIYKSKPTPKYVHRFNDEGHVIMNPTTFEPELFFKDLDFDEINKWLEENINKDSWWLKTDIVPGSGDPNPESTTQYLSICFLAGEEDAVAFKLRWI